MTGQVPVACSLSGGEATVRAAEIARLGSESLISASIFSDSASMRFAVDAKGDLETIISAESACCPFFKFEVAETREYIDVLVSAPEDAGLAVKELVAAFEADRSAS